MTTDYTERIDAIEARLDQWLEAELVRFDRELAEADRGAFGHAPGARQPVPVC